MICTWNPSPVGVVLPNVGVNQAASETPVIVDPPTMLFFVAVIVAVEGVSVATPVTVIKPLPLMATEPDAVAVPAHE